MNNQNTNLSPKQQIIFALVFMSCLFTAILVTGYADKQCFTHQQTTNK
jgi:hypothetical protein